MCGNKFLFTTLKDHKAGSVTFGDGGKAPILGKGTVEVEGMPPFKNVLFVVGLKANLLSISQICDSRFKVHFGKNSCSVFDSDGECVVQGTCTSDNCYGISPHTELKCSSVKIDESELWHQRLGRVNYRDLSKISRKELVIGLPKLDNVKNRVCGPCQLGKQIKSVHKRTSDVMTKRPLELLHMDLMGPSRTESLGGKKYIMVVVDDFSRFTWVDLLREKSDAFERAKIL